MKSVLRLLCLLLLALCTFPSAASKINVDSLKQKVTAMSEEDTAKVRALIRLFEVTISKKDTLVIAYLDQARKIAEKHHYEKGVGLCAVAYSHFYIDNEKYKQALVSLNQAREIFTRLNYYPGMVEYFKGLASYYYDTNDFKRAISLSDSVLRINAAQPKPDEDIITRMYTLKGDINIQYGKYSEAIENLTVVRKIYQKDNNKIEEATVLRNIGVVYIYQNNYKLALDYFLQALKIDEVVGNPNTLSASHNNIGGVYKYLNDLDNAEKHYLIGLKYAQDGKKLRMESMCLNNLGELYTIQKKYPKALECSEQSLKIRQELNDNRGEADAMLNIGLIYLHMGDHAHSLDYLNRVKSVAKQIGVKEMLKETYLGISDNYNEMKDYKSALDYFREYNALKDTLLNEKTSKQVTEINTKYETEKKEAQIALLNKDKILSDTELAKKNAEVQQKNTQRNAFIVGFGLVLILTGFIFRSGRQQRRANAIISQQNTELAQQKQEVILQKNIIEEKNTSIVDSIQYARRIQRALLASEPLLKKNLTDYFVYYKPKDIVSGDFYWAAEIGGAASPRFLLCAADCTGHGVPGAFMSLLNISLLNETVIEKKISSTDLVLNNVRDSIIKALNPEGTGTESKDGMDCILCSFDFRNRQLDFSCSNNPLWIIRNKEVMEYQADKFPVGIHQGELKPFTKKSVQLEKGDTVYLLTDGYADQFGGPKGKKFKYKALQELLAANSDRSMEEQREVLSETLEDWKGNLEQVDDILIIGVKVV